SEHPPAGAVTSPVDKQAKEADVDRMAFRQGRMPDNQQIDQTLAYVRDHLPIHVNKLSPEGKKFIQDLRDIVETARLMVAEKNADELFRNFIWHTR
ncbi:hypothetical protein BD410DRAFT_687000, partial [Rickenella mellea]